MDEQVTAQAAAFLEYVRGVEQRLVAAEARVAELAAATATATANIRRTAVTHYQ